MKFNPKGIQAKIDAIMMPDYPNFARIGYVWNVYYFDKNGKVHYRAGEINMDEPVRHFIVNVLPVWSEEIRKDVEAEIENEV